MDFLVVDFNKTASDQMSLSSIVLCLGNYLTESSRNYTTVLFALVSSHHSVRFTATGLSVGKDGAIVSIQDTFY